MSSQVNVQVPQVGESVTEASIGKWIAKNGDVVTKNEPLFELDSDKASMEVTAEEAGKLEILVEEGETVLIGATVAKIDTSVSASAKPSKSSTEKSQKKEPRSSAASSGATATAIKVDVEAKAQPAKEDLKDFSPSQRRAIRHGKVSVLKTPKTSNQSLSGLPSDDKREPMSRLRTTIANRLMHSQQSTATLTTFNEVDMSQLLKVRTKLKADFQSKFDVKLGFMSFFSSAVIEAMKELPIVNKHIDGSEIVEPSGVHIGIAVSTERGLVVPVLKNAESMNYADIEKGIGALAEKARDGKLSIAEMQGGSFTITNGGVFGSLLSTPILNPPQSGILGMHKTEHRPIAIEKSKGEFSVEVRPMMYLALSYDHRLIDGATSVGFLVKIKEYIENVTEDQVMA